MPSRGRICLKNKTQRWRFLHKQNNIYFLLANKSLCECISLKHKALKICFICDYANFSVIFLDILNINGLIYNLLGILNRQSYLWEATFLKSIQKYFFHITFAYSFINRLLICKYLVKMKKKCLTCNNCYILCT